MVEHSLHAFERAGFSNPSSGALIHALNPSDYHAERTSRHHDVASGLLPSAEVFNSEHDKQLIASHRGSASARLAAAERLAAHGITDFTATGKDGAEHNYKIDATHDENGTTVQVHDGEALALGGQIAEDGTIQVDYDEGKQTISPEGQPIYDGVPHQKIRLPSGMHYHGGGRAHYRPHLPTRRYAPDPAYADQIDPDVWQAVQAADGSVVLNANGCRVDTDGTGAFRHLEDGTKQSQTSLRCSNGLSLDTDRDNYFVLPPAVAKAYHIKLGDLGWLVRKDTGEAVPIVFGDCGPNNPSKFGEASVHSLKSLRFKDVSGSNGVDGTQFQIIFYPGSGNGTGDIARDPGQMADLLNKLAQEKGAGAAQHVNS
jgi:hypothetical protein